MMFALNYMAVCYGLKSSLSNFYNPYKKPMEEIFDAKSRQITTFPAGKIGGGAVGRTNLANEVCQIWRHLERGSFSRS